MDKDSMDAEMNESLTSCSEAVNRISELIENVLEFSRKASSDKSVHSFEWCYHQRYWHRAARVRN